MSFKQPLVLFISVILIDSPRRPGKPYQLLLEKEMNSVRYSSPVYKSQSKVDIFKYMLLSLSVIEWDGIFIDLEIGEGFTPDDQSSICNFAKDIFNTPINFGSSRSSSRPTYIKRLREIKAAFPNCFLFYSPNHDHIYYAPNNSCLKDSLDLFSDLRVKHSSPLRICYSHQFESLVASSPSSRSYDKNLLGGDTLSEDSFFRVIKRKRFAWDSFYICHIDDFYSFVLMSNISDDHYAPRGEDFYPYPFPPIDNIVIIPKYPLCHHYDGYFHYFRDLDYSTPSIYTYVPPLFIPPGFFESSIHLRYGFSDLKNGCLSLHPDADAISCDPSSKINSNIVADVKMRMSEIPLFWKNRISRFVVNSHYQITQADKTIQPLRFHDFL